MLRWLRALMTSAVIAVAHVAMLSSPSPVDAHPAATSTGYHITVRPDGQPPLSIYVEEMGRGPVILLLHGLGGSSYTWRQIAPRLAAGHRVMAIDLRGFGRSDKPFDQAYSPAEHAAVIRAFIQSRNLSRITLVGHSFGGFLSLLLAMDRRLEPHRIARLILIDAPAYPQPMSAGVRFLRKPILPYVALLLMPPEVMTSVAFWMEKFGFDRLTERDISIYADPLGHSGGPHALIETALQIVPPDLPRIVARYPTISKPALLLWCRDDQVVPLATGQRLARALPHAQLSIVDGCDHVPTEQAPEAIVGEMRRFLTRGGNGPQP